MDTAQIRQQALQMAIQVQAQRQASSGPETDAITVTRAQAFFAFLNDDTGSPAVTTAAAVNLAAAAAGAQPLEPVSASIPE